MKAAAKGASPDNRLQDCSLEALDNISADTFVGFCFQDLRPLRGPLAFVDWRMGGGLSQAIANHSFSGEAGEAMLTPLSGRLGQRRVLMFGLGGVGAVSGDEGKQLVAQAQKSWRGTGAKAVAILSPRCRDPKVDQTWRDILTSLKAPEVVTVLV